MGREAPWLSEVQELITTLPWEVGMVVDVADMATVMTENDLAIGAAGGTALERCCLGLPSLLVVLAENQRAGAHAFEASGSCVLVGEPSDIESDLPSKLEILMEGSTLRDMQLACSRVTDGNGTNRVLNMLTKLSG